MRQPIDCAITEIVPHAHPMCLLDRAIAADEESLSAELTLREDSAFLQPEGVPSWVGIEYMAQAIGAWAGWHARLAGRPPRVGFLLGSRRYETQESWFRLGDHLLIDVRQTFQADNGLGQFECHISRGEGILASAALTVFEPADLQQFMTSLPT